MGLIGVGSSSDNEARGFLIGGNSVVLIDGTAVTDSEGVGYVGDMGEGELSWSITGGAGVFFSTEGSTMAGAVIERLGAIRPAIMEGTFSLVALTVSSETTLDVGLDRAKP